MSHPMLPLLERTPVIPAVKEPETLDRALCHDGAAVFLLCGDILNIACLKRKSLDRVSLSRLEICFCICFLL